MQARARGADIARNEKRVERFAYGVTGSAAVPVPTLRANARSLLPLGTV